MARTHIEGMIQAAKYDEATNRLYFRLRAGGQDVTSPGTTPTITIYDTYGDELVAATNMTQVGSTAVFYYDLDTTATTSYVLGYNYRAQVDFDDGTLEITDHFLFDVVMWPHNEPLWTTTEVDLERPMWAGARPAGWSDWTVAIEMAHRRLIEELRYMKDNNGDPIYASRILDRGHLREVEQAFIDEAIVNNMRFPEETKAEYRQRARDAISNYTLFLLDRDDDLSVDSDEEATGGPTFLR